MVRGRTLHRRWCTMLVMRLTSLIVAIAIAVLGVIVAACGSTESPTPTSTRAASTPTNTPVPSADNGATPAQGWRTDLTVGASIGEVAPDSTLMLPDGNMASLQQIAAGHPLLIYFFETW